VLRVSRAQRLLARSTASTTLYLSVGAQTLHAAVFAQDTWQLGSMVELPVQADAAGEQRSAQEVLLDSLQLLQHHVAAHLESGVLAQGDVEVRVGVSTRWLPNETLLWSDVQGAVGLRALAADYLQQSGFSIELQDVVRWEDSPWGSPRWVIAYPAALVHALEQVARAVRGRLVSVLPTASLVAQLFSQQCARVGDVGYVESGLFHLVEVSDGCVQSTVQRALDDSVLKTGGLRLAEGVSRLWHGIQLRTPHLYEVTELAVLFEGDALEFDGATDLKLLAWPQAAQPQIAPMLRALRTVRHAGNALDAIKARASFSVKSIFLLGVATVVVLVLVLLSLLNLQVIHKLESARQVSRAKVVQSAPTAASKVQQDQVLAINAAIRQLNMPVAELLKTLNPPKDIRVSLLGIDLSDSVSDTGLPKLKLNAEALSGEDMTRYVGFLDGRRPFVQATLVRHEVMSAVSASPWRFTMELTWQP
jgi:hypothetical protein